MKKVLVVDDDKLLRDSVAKALTDRGYQVFQAADGEEGFAKAQENTPDLIITDVMMPNLDGIGMLKKIRSFAWGEHTPVLVLTIKDADIENVNTSMQIGNVSYLSKAEVSREQLLSLVDQQFQKQA